MFGPVPAIQRADTVWINAFDAYTHPKTNWVAL